MRRYSWRWVWTDETGGGETPQGQNQIVPPRRLFPNPIGGQPQSYSSPLMDQRYRGTEDDAQRTALGNWMNSNVGATAPTSFTDVNASGGAIYNRSYDPATGVYTNTPQGGWPGGGQQDLPPQTGQPNINPITGRPYTFADMNPTLPFIPQPTPQPWGPSPFLQRPFLQPREPLSNFRASVGGLQDQVRAGLLAQDQARALRQAAQQRLQTQIQQQRSQQQYLRQSQRQPRRSDALFDAVFEYLGQPR